MAASQEETTVRPKVTADLLNQRFDPILRERFRREAVESEQDSVDDEAAAARALARSAASSRTRDSQLPASAVTTRPCMIFAAERCFSCLGPDAECACR